MIKTNPRLRILWKKTVICMISLVLVAVLTIPGTNTYAEDDRWPLHLKAEQYSRNGQTELAALIWDDLMRRAAAASDWLTAALYAGYLDEYYDAAHNYEKAIHYYELENEYWLNDGKDWGSKDFERAYQLRTTVELYASALESDELLKASLPASGKLAKFEPAYGMYIGVYSELDPQMGNFFTRSQSIYGKSHAIYLAYATYGEPFPSRYASNAKAAGGALQVAWQPLQGLGAVKDDAYIREWAMKAKESGIPIFLRFAGEMNGDWTPWAGEAGTFIEKFRIVADVMHELAPNVALVWSPGDVPRYTMNNYYPGDPYVDWVGVSLYTEPYSNGSSNESLLGSTPIEKLDEMYRLYAERKPIMLSETAVSHQTKIDGQTHVDYALLNMERLYRVMPLKYPRLKAITYFNVDPVDKESKNNYSLGRNEEILKLYKSMIADPFYLTEVKTGAKPSDGTGYQDGTKPFAKKTTLVPFVRIPDVFIARLDYVLNGQVIGTRTEPPFQLELMAGDVPQDSVLEIRVFNKEGKQAVSRSFPVSSQVSVTIDRVDQSFEQPPVIVNGVTMTPLRAIFERMGATVSWNSETQTATGSKGGRAVTLTIGSKIVKVDDKIAELEEPVQLINGHTMGPARFIGEAFGGQVDWDVSTRTVNIRTR